MKAMNAEALEGRVLRVAMSKTAKRPWDPHQKPPLAGTWRKTSPRRRTCPDEVTVLEELREDPGEELSMGHEDAEAGDIEARGPEGKTGRLEGESLGDGE